MDNPDTTNALDVIEKTLKYSLLRVQNLSALGSEKDFNHDENHSKPVIKNALSLIQAIRDEIPEGLDNGLRNAIKPSYDIHITCPNCDKEGTINNGEWLLWCGHEKSAQALLDTAKLLNKIKGE